MASPPPLATVSLAACALLCAASAASLTSLGAALPQARHATLHAKFPPGTPQAEQVQAGVRGPSKTLEGPSEAPLLAADSLPCRRPPPSAGFLSRGGLRVFVL